MPRLNRAQLTDQMKKAGVPGVSIAYVQANKDKPEIEPLCEGQTDELYGQPGVKVDENTIFGAASLSKPVFAYFVLQLIQNKQLQLPNKQPIGLDTPFYEMYPIEDFYKDHCGIEVNEDTQLKAKDLTVRMVLSHTSGLSDRGPFFDFEPGKEYGYSGMPLVYLQKAIKNQTGRSLEDLAQEFFHKDKLNMPNSTFVPPEIISKKTLEEDTTNNKNQTEKKIEPPIAANSLYTTPSDYGHFVAAVLKDKPMRELMFGFERPASLVNDRWADAMGIDADKRQHLGWGLGFGFERDKKTGDIISAFHSGDMDQWRSWVGIDLINNTAIIYFANANDPEKAYGHTLADAIIKTPELKLENAKDWFFTKFGFARTPDNGFQNIEAQNMDVIKNILPTLYNKNWQPQPPANPIYQSFKTSYGSIQHQLHETTPKMESSDHDTRNSKDNMEISTKEKEPNPTDESTAEENLETLSNPSPLKTKPQPY